MQVNLMTSFNSASFPDSLAIAKESGLTIGSIDEIQKLHIRAVPMGEQARRLAHQESSHTFLVTTSSESSGAPHQHTTPIPHIFPCGHTPSIWQRYISTYTTPILEAPTLSHLL